MTTKQLQGKRVLCVDECMESCKTHANQHIVPLLVVSMDIVRSSSGSLQVLPRVMILPGSNC